MKPIELAQKTLIGHAPGPRLLITGGVHGDEFEPMAAAPLVAGDRPAEIAGNDHHRAGGERTCVSAGERTAEDEKDLARTCPGRDDGSTTERIAAALTRMIHGADFYIDLHTAGTVFRMLPLAGYTLHADEGVRERQRSMARAFNLPVVWGTSRG